MNQPPDHPAGQPTPHPSSPDSAPASPADDRSRWGGVIHAYQKYDPETFPGPREQGSSDLLDAALEHSLRFGNRRRLTPEELANAIRLDPSQIAGLGPPIESLLAILEERKRRILASYQVQSALRQSQRRFAQAAQQVQIPKELEQPLQRALRSEQPYALDHLWYQLEQRAPQAAKGLLNVKQRMTEKHQIQELISRYTFTGRTAVSVEEALQIKAELEQIDRLLEQLQEAAQSGRVALLDWDALRDQISEEQRDGGSGDDEDGIREHDGSAHLAELQAAAKRIEQWLQQQMEQQGLHKAAAGDWQLTPKAYKTIQQRLLTRIFSDLKPSRSGRHTASTIGEGAVELATTRPYQPGDSLGGIDFTQSLVNALLRTASSTNAADRPAAGQPTANLRLWSQDIEVHQTRNRPRCATCVIMDMSGSMRYDDQYMHVKRMALAMQALITSEYPGDFLRFIEMYTFAKLRPAGEVIQILPKPVTIHDPWVQLKVDMSRADISESMVHPHFTNIQHSLRLARQQLAAVDTPNRQIVLITDGLPTAHFEDQWLYMLYPPHPRTEAATMREAQLCAAEGITINLFLIPSWSQSEEDVQFAYRMAQATRGRVIFASGQELDRFVVWDYVNQRRDIIG